MPSTLWIFSLSVAVTAGLAHKSCDSAPTLSQKLSCEKIMSWNEMTKPVEEELKNNRSASNRLSAVKKEPTELGDCMDLRCMAQFLTGNKDVEPPYTYKGKVLRKVVRKEVRMMSDAEWKRLVAAIQELKDNGAYEEIAMIHMTVTEASNAHGGPAFFPWHREYVKRFELALRAIDPDLYVPYWDSTLESGLPRPADTIVFSPHRFGSGKGPVLDGPWGTWITDNNTQIQRSVGENGDPFIERDLRKLMNYTKIDDVLCQTGGPELFIRGCRMEVNWEWFEMIHGNAHNWLGGWIALIGRSLGDMLTTLYATRDPVFYMHHSFVDLIWEAWRLKNQNRTQRETAYPANKKCMTTLHWPTATLIPFNKRNIDALSNAYTDNLYTFGRRPYCTKKNPTCGSKYLFCDLRSNPRCQSKIRLGGNCTGFTHDEPMCFGGKCIQGVCVSTDKLK